jgi:6,7-dimethyl-8-ribityllumazine synthase
VDVLWVPGAFEIPFLCQTLAATKKYQALIALGAVIRGDTDHYDYVCSAVTNGVAQVSLKYDLPVIFGLLTTNTLEQARDRIGGKAGHKGEEAAMAAIEMISLLKSNHLGSFRPHSGHTLQHQNHDVLNNQ